MTTEPNPDTPRLVRHRRALNDDTAETLRAVHRAREDAREAFYVACAARTAAFRATHGQGVSCRAIADAVGLHKSAVQQVVRRSQDADNRR